MQPTAGTVVFRCPKCEKPHRAMESAVGKPITCSNCRTTFTVPTSDAPLASKSSDPPPSTKPQPVTYWQPVTPAELPPAEPQPDPNDWMNAAESEPVIARRPKPRRSFAIWKIAILIGHLTLIAAAVAVWFILQRRDK
jgi:hypothetical protein